MSPETDGSTESLAELMAGVERERDAAILHMVRFADALSLSAARQLICSLLLLVGQPCRRGFDLLCCCAACLCMGPDD